MQETQDAKVYIGDLTSTVHAVDGDSLLSPRQMDKIVRAVLEAVNDRQAHARRVRAETHVTSGLAYEMDKEGC
jgi:hypothetical protein